MNGLEFDAASHIYTLDGSIVTSVTGAIRAAVFNGVPLMETRWFTDAARDRGSYVHQCVEIINTTGGIDWAGVDPEMEPYVRAYAKFLDDSNFTPFAVECRVASRRYRYAGTIDALGLMGEFQGNVLLDVKSGPPARWHKWQLGGYAEALVETGYRVDRAFTLQVKRDGSYEIHGVIEGQSLLDNRAAFVTLRSALALAGDPPPEIENANAPDDGLTF